MPTLIVWHTVVAIDRRGHGQSPAYSGEDTLCDDFADLAHIVAAIGEPVAMFAHSAGCHVALGPVLRGAPLRRLVLYEAPTFGDPPIAAEIWRLLDDAVARDDRPALVEMILNDLVGRSNGELIPPPALAGIPSSPFGALLLDNALSAPTEFRAMEGYVWTDEDLRALTTPTTVVVGGQSPPFNRRFSDRLVRLSGAAHLVVLPGAGHGTPLMDPAVILESIGAH